MYLGVCISNFVFHSRFVARPARAGTTEPGPQRALHASSAAISGADRSQSSRPISAWGLSANRLEDPTSAVRPRHDTLLAVRRALEAAGAEFIFEPGRKPGVREA